MTTFQTRDVNTRFFQDPVPEQLNPVWNRVPGCRQMKKIQKSENYQKVMYYNMHVYYCICRWRQTASR